MKYTKTMRWLRKLNGEKYKCLIDYLKTNPFDSIIELEDKRVTDIEDNVEVQYLIVNTEARVIYLEFDSRLRTLVQMYTFGPRLFNELSSFMENCNYYFRCITVFNGKLNWRICYGSGICETLKTMEYNSLSRKYQVASSR